MYRKIRNLICLVTLAAAGALAGCSGPCEELSDAICSCRANNTEMARCQEQVRSSMSIDPSDAQNQQCELFLETCTCDALEQNMPEKCGLAKARVD